MFIKKADIKKLIKSLSKTALYIMHYGSFLSLGILIIGIFSYFLNKTIWNESFVNYMWSIKIVTSAQSLFVQTFFYALLFECVRLGK